MAEELLKPKRIEQAPTVTPEMPSFEPTPALDSREPVESEPVEPVEPSTAETVESAPAVEQTAPTTPVPVQAVTSPVPAKDRLTKEIESVMEEDMTDLFLSMPPKTQQEFKKKGEETASKIRVLVTKAKVNAKKVFELLRAWLKVIPGVNRFFLEQEAKIKTDKILRVVEEERRRGSEEIA